MASDHDNGQIGRDYSVRRVIRFGGKLHPAADCATAREGISSTTTIYEEKKIWSRDYGTEYKTYARTVDNPDYKAQQNTIKALTCVSARLGMRATLDFLWRFSSTDGAEAAEFHNSWYEMIESYSSRNLIRHEDKLMVISGVAYFIQKNTIFQYNSGLWEQIMPFNMPWTVSGKPKSRPSRPVPTWSWASMDGKLVIA
jgi:hypothetical protein